MPKKKGKKEPEEPQRLEPCSFSGQNFVQYDVQPDEDTAEMVLDVEAIQDKFRAYRIYKKGYEGMILFLIFAIWYIAVLGQQDHEPSIGQANSGIKDMFEKAKADLKITNSATAWKFLGTAIVPMMIGVPWESSRSDYKHHDMNQGSKSFGYFITIGGLAITAGKDQNQKCFRGQPCFSPEPMQDEFYELTLPGGTTFQVPYNDKMGGYTVGLPTSTSPANVAELLAGYAGLFGPDTREIHLDATLFNPNAEKTISSVRISSRVSISNDISVAITLNTIPYHMYSADPFTRYKQYAYQIGMLLFCIIFLVKPFVQAKFCEPSFDPRLLTSGNNEARFQQRLIRLKWLQYWDFLPTARDGELLFWLPATLIAVISCAVLFWLYMCLIYNNAGVGNFGANDLDNVGLFQDPLAPYADADLAKKMSVSLQNFEEFGFPLIEQGYHIANLFSHYFMLQAVIVVMIMLRFLQYLSFQKRLSMVTDTFADVGHEFLHIFSVLAAICFTLGVMYSLSCGPLDPPYREFMPSFWHMLEMPFAMFKPGASMQINPPPQKYAPHTTIGNAYISWMPLLVVLIFKVLIMLLLFKLLMGVIMASYKKSEKKKKHTRPVTAEIRELWTLRKYSFWNNMVLGEPYVSFEHLVIALSNMEPDEAQPWRKRFIGFGSGPEAVTRLLNSILQDPDDFSKPFLKAVVEHHNFQRCGRREALFCMRFFGTNRSIAKYEFRDWVIETETKKYEAQMKKKQKPDETADIKTRAEHHAKVLLKDVAKKLAQVEHRQDMESEIRNETISDEEVDTIFEAYDFYKTGQVDIRFMKNALAALGYSLPYSVSRKLIKEYDDDENHCFDKLEFKSLLKDRKLLGRRFVVAGSKQQAQSMQNGDKMQNMLVQHVAQLAQVRERNPRDPMLDP